MNSKSMILLGSGLAALGGALYRIVSNKNSEGAKKELKSELILLGCGSSSGTPNLLCLVEGAPGCTCCQKALIGPATENKNVRGNPSLLIRYAHPKGHTENIIIDVCKTFREATLRWFVKHNIDHLDGIILTHGHADAILGLDDIRNLQKFTKAAGGECLTGRLLVNLSSECLKICKKVFPYLMPRDEPQAVSRKVAQLEWRTFEDFKPFAPVPAKQEQVSIVTKNMLLKEKQQQKDNEDTNNQDDLKDDHDDKELDKVPETKQEHDPSTDSDENSLMITPLPVWHGSDLISHAFQIGGSRNGGDWIVYISDVSELTERTRTYLQEEEKARGSPIDLLFIDSLFIERDHPTHFNLEDTFAFVKEFRPKRAVIVGMTDNFDYYSTNDEIRARAKREGVNLEMGYDGMQFQTHLK